ncbi:unnamed protein product, partial [Iphiclides podalirius]
MLGSIKYRPPATVEPSLFRAKLLAGDSRTIHHVMHWLLSNKEQVKKTAYLAKYLKIPDIPSDVARNNTIQDLLDLYHNLIDEFKDVHKRTRLLEKENSTEMINDIKEMAVERDIVIKRLENVQVNLIDVSNKEDLLSVSKALRLQQERTKELENQISTVNGEIEQLVQRRLAATGPQDDKLAPFRQQAAVIKRNKEASAERVNELTVTLKEQEAILADLQAQVEAGILSRTLHILNVADPTIEMALVNHKKMKIEDDDLLEKTSTKTSEMTKKSFHDLSQIVAQTAQELSQVRLEIQPLVDKIKPIKEKYQVIQQQYEQKKRIYEATSINITSQMEPLKNEVKELSDKLNSKEMEWKNLRQKITKAESLQQDVMFEMKNSMQSPRKPSKIEILKKKVRGLEEIVKNLEEGAVYLLKLPRYKEE